MKLWVVRGGRHGAYEEMALERGLACLGWVETPSLAKARSREDISEILRAAYPDYSVAQISNNSGQLNAFAREMARGDLVVMPLKGQPQLAIGRVTGDYEYRRDLGEGIRHARSVKWIRPDVPRSLLQPDLLRAMGGIQTVFGIKRNNAVERIQAITNGQADPGFQPAAAEEETQGEEAVAKETEDIEQTARDQIRRYIQDNFPTHDLARLLEAALQAEGYATARSEPGPDGGVDILARRGPLGFEGAKLCVQVKSSSSSVDVRVLRELQGTMTNFKADEGLLVSWGGFNRAARKEARQSFFSVRLWDADDLIAALQRNYSRLPEELRKELPLKQVWALVTEE